MSTNNYENKKNEISDTFDYLKHMALDAFANRKVLSMRFTLDFDVESVPVISSKITEVTASEVDT